MERRKKHQRGLIFVLVSLIFLCTIYIDDVQGEMPSIEEVSLEERSSQIFTDLSEDSATTPMIIEFFHRGLITGYPDRSFRPLSPLTRAEFVTLINRTFNYENRYTALDFVDVNSSDWFYGSLSAAVYLGYINGYPDNTFRPQKTITRQEAAVILNRILTYDLKTYVEMEDSVPVWANKAVQAMVSNGVILLHDKAFDGEMPLTREEAVVSLLTIIHQQEEMIDISDDKVASGLDPFISTKPDEGNKETGGSPDLGDEDVPSEVVYALHISVNGLASILEGETSYARALNKEQLGIVDQVKITIEAYLDDYSYDIKSEQGKVRKQVKKMTEEEQEELKDAIQVAVPAEHISLLREFFDV